MCGFRNTLINFVFNSKNSWTQMRPEDITTRDGTSHLRNTNSTLERRSFEWNFSEYNAIIEGSIELRTVKKRTKTQLISTGMTCILRGIKPLVTKTSIRNEKTFTSIDLSFIVTLENFNLYGSLQTSVGVF